MLTISSFLYAPSSTYHRTLSPPHHTDALAKELIAGIAGAEVDEVRLSCLSSK